MRLKWIPAVLWTAFIVYALVSEPSGIPRFPWLAKPGVDKVIHAILFGVESGLFIWAAQSNNLKRQIWMILLWCVFLGGALEVVQYYWVVGRSGDLTDLVADTVGAIVPLMAAWLTRKNNHRVE